jgi:hypothetical protein
VTRKNKQPSSHSLSTDNSIDQTRRLRAYTSQQGYLRYFLEMMGCMMTYVVHGKIPLIRKHIFEWKITEFLLK